VEPFIFDDPARKHWDLAVWGNGDVGVEVGSRVGLHLRGFAGVGSCGIAVLDAVVVATTGHVSLADRGWR
jgi:hypothetical protein